MLCRLEALQAAVVALREPGGPWSALGVGALTAIEHDVLALAIAPEARPRLSWLFQSLQPGAAHAYPTLALVHELLALENGAEVAALHECLGGNSVLGVDRLLRVESADPLTPIRPAPGVTARLLGWSDLGEAPPGAMLVRMAGTWDDLILPEDRIEMVRELLLWVRHRDTVVGNWGGAATGGPVALFAGPSGTGKTLAASVIANELGWPLYRIDLGKLVSKYIGETEKNMNRLFDAAHGRAMILQFDEADSLFSKRGEVKEARDRYANMEVSHLLARIESHHGPCILTTNLRNHIDQAFARRFQVVVEFPRPEADARVRLWARLLPPRAPRSPEVDPEFLGHSVNLTGGSIRNAALHAAYLAADACHAITLAHVAIAVYRELSKDGRAATRSDLGPLARHLPPGYGR
jgi:ATPase family associated with various cellular activities (AAA)